MMWAAAWRPIATCAPFTDRIAGNTGNNDLGTFHEAEILQVMLQISLPRTFTTRAASPSFKKRQRHLLNGHAGHGISVCRTLRSSCHHTLHVALPS